MYLYLACYADYEALSENDNTLIKNKLESESVQIFDWFWSNCF